MTRRAEVWQIISGQPDHGHHARDHGQRDDADADPNGLRGPGAGIDIGGNVHDQSRHGVGILVSHTRSGFAQTHGLAPVSQAVSLDASTAARSGPIFRKDYAADSVTGYPPKWQAVAVAATDGTHNLAQSGHIYLPPAVESFVYDDDGNLIEDGRWQYTWDAENRLVSLTTRAAAVTAGVPELRLTFAYDARSRRVRKLVEQKVASVWETRSDTRFIYDGWNLVAEVEYFSEAADAPKSGAVTQTAAFVRRSYVWGPDVSGSWEGAGGVGGLLSVTRHERGTRGAETYWATMDLNGNVIGLVGTTTNRVAVYEYDAYGKCVRANEPEAGLNPVRFSSKYTDAETDLSYYGYRYYSPKMRQWLSRDPIEEKGGLNLYGMVGNDVSTRIDYLGLAAPHVTAQLRAAQANYNAIDVAGEVTDLIGLKQAIGNLLRYADMAGEIMVDRLPQRSKDGTTTGMFSRWDKAFIVPAQGYSMRTALHESVHSFNYFKNTGLNWRDDEGMAYLITHLDDLAKTAGSMEQLVRRAASGNEDIYADELQQSWASFWEDAERLPTGNYQMLFNFSFDLTERDVSNLRKYLGVKFSCSEIAQVMNRIFPRGCYRFECTTNSQDRDPYRGPSAIYLKQQLETFK